MRNNKVSILADIASAILAATRERRATINNWYLSDSDYDVYAQASRSSLRRHHDENLRRIHPSLVVGSYVPQNN